MNALSLGISVLYIMVWISIYDDQSNAQYMKGLIQGACM